MKKSERSILAALIFCLFFVFVLDSDRQAADIRNSTLRLHIIARDDSTVSQHIKSQVKNATEKLWPAIYCDAQNFQQAVTKTEENLEYIQQITDNTLKNLCADYTSRCSLEQIYFDTTTIDGKTLPRGMYTALTIRLGQAQGKNWWCILYPEMSLGTGAEYEENPSGTIYETNRFRLKLKTVELWQKAKSFFTDTEMYSHI